MLQGLGFVLGVKLQVVAAILLGYMLQGAGSTGERTMK